MIFLLVLVFCKLLRENCSIIVKDAKELENCIYGKLGSSAQHQAQAHVHLSPALNAQHQLEHATPKCCTAEDLET
jgi:acetone carboxylase gamma subunit